MKYVQAAIVMGLFGWLSYSVYTDTLPGGDGGSSKTRILKEMVSSMTDQFGVVQTSAGLAAIGLLLAAIFLMRRDAEDHDY